jgi:hypothetical protein
MEPIAQDSLGGSTRGRGSPAKKHPKPVQIKVSKTK